MFSQLAQTSKQNGIKSLWKGLSAGLLRQAFYGTTRFGAFESFRDMAKAKSGRDLQNYEKVSCALVAGGLAGFVGNPPDVALTRMASDDKLPVDKRRGYRNGVQAMGRIWKEEGFWKGLMCGVTTNVQRSIIVNGIMLGSYSVSKDWMQKQTGLGPTNPILLLLAGNVAGLATAMGAVPADMVKTRLQHALPGEYSGAVDVVRKTLAKRGVGGLWAGFIPTWVKLALHTSVSFSVIEKCREAYVNA